MMVKELIRKLLDYKPTAEVMDDLDIVYIGFNPEDAKNVWLKDPRPDKYTSLYEFMLSEERIENE